MLVRGRRWNQVRRLVLGNGDEDGGGGLWENNDFDDDMGDDE